MRSPALLIAIVFAAACSGGEDASTSESSVALAQIRAADVTVLAALSDALPDRTGILPDALAPAVGQLVEHFTADDTLARLRVVCMRFDPAGQIRFVLQPLLTIDGVTSAQDAAVHVFYDLDAATTRDLARHLAAHDTVVQDFVARGSLSRVTFMRNTDVKGNGWVFGGVDVRAGVATPLVVARVGGSEQRVVVNGGSSSLAPAPAGADTLGVLLEPARLGILFDIHPAGARARIDAGLAGARALEDPARHDPKSADCVSCHLAESARVFGEGFGGTPAKTFTAAESLRACGYVGTKPIMSQRTINETALAAQKMTELAR